MATFVGPTDYDKHLFHCTQTFANHRYCDPLCDTSNGTTTQWTVLSGISPFHQTIGTKMLFTTRRLHDAIICNCIKTNGTWT